MFYKILVRSRTMDIFCFVSLFDTGRSSLSRLLVHSIRHGDQYLFDQPNFFTHDQPKGSPTSALSIAEMSVDSRDLFHRRTNATAKTKALQKSTDRTSVSRKKRGTGHDKAAVATLITFAALLTGLGILLWLRTGNESKSSANSKDIPVTDHDQLTMKFKPRSLRTVIENEIQGDARLTSNEKEERYHFLYRPKFDASTLGYDIYNCPPTPPDDYPHSWYATEVLSNWNPNDVTTIPPFSRSIYQGLCIFDYHTQYCHRHSSGFFLHLF